MEKFPSNSTFSLPRFKALAKADFSLHRSDYIKLSIAVVGCFIALAILISIYAIPEIKHIYEHSASDALAELQAASVRNNMLSVLMSIGLWLCACGLTMFGSLTFSNMSSKRKRISAIMMPASKSEKFIFRTLVYGLGGFLLLAAGMGVALLIIQICFGGAQTLGNMWSKLFDNKESVYFAVCAVLAAICGGAIYTLGSSIWPKLSWLKTWLAVVVIEWLLGIAFIIILTSGINFAVLDALISIDTLFWSIATLEVLAIAGCLILSWRRFCGMQLIQRFMKK